MKFTRIGFLGLLSVLASGISAQISPCALSPIAVEDRIAESEEAVWAQETRRFCTWNDQHNTIVTLHELEIKHRWIGSSNAARIWVLTEGGQLGSLGRTVYGAAQIAAAQEGVYLLKKVTGRTFETQNLPVVYELVCGPQGQFSLIEGQMADCCGEVSASLEAFQAQYFAQAAPFALPKWKDSGSQVMARANASITSLSPNPIIGGMQTLTIEGSGFGSSQGNSYVSFARDGVNYFDANTAKGFVYKSWSDSKIEVEVPETYSGKVRVYVNGIYGESADVLHVKANVGMATINPREYFHLWNLNENGGHTWYMRRDLYNNTEARACIEGVFAEFRCKTGVNYTLTRQPTWVKSDLGDGVNALMFDSVGYELPNGVVAYYEQLWYSCILGGRTFYYVMGQELRISKRFDYYYGKGSIPQGKNAKLSYVLFHELGHSLQLGHVNEDGESMHPVVQALPADNWNMRDTLTTFDVKAARYLVQESQQFDFRACGVSPMGTISNCADVYGENAGLSPSLARMEISVLPNPSQGTAQLMMNIDRHEALEISIVNASGQQVYQAPLEGHQHSLPKLPSGLYFVSVTGQELLGFTRWVVE
ncbi:MAG: T9SS type A sorting domain-containing protein [Bacteroidetes bacterium]|nr:T9SS type A sorting domain-containing protein [Bacteroidota bacterium]MDA1112355.1 T9SS type A sorting domain-containing protein [Bacteroidota bacterium]